MELQGSLLFVLILLVVYDIIAMAEDGQSGVKPGSERVVGGELANIQDFPFVVSIQTSRLKDLNAHSMHSCGGTLVGLTWVLTAAHCTFKGSAYLYVVVAGSSNSYEVPNAHEGFQQIRLVKRFHKHKQYMKTTDENDIALIQLSTAMVPSTHVQVKKLLDHAAIAPGTLCDYAGWGETEVRGSTLLPPGARRVTADRNATKKTESELKAQRRQVPEMLLRHIQTPLVEFGACLASLRTIYKNSNRFVLEDKIHVCAGAEAGKGTCFGDSGGPLVCNGHVTGVFSWLTGCGKKYPDVFVKVSNYLPWIRSTIKAYSSTVT